MEAEQESGWQPPAGSLCPSGEGGVVKAEEGLAAARPAPFPESPSTPGLMLSSAETDSSLSPVPYVPGDDGAGP